MAENGPASAAVPLGERTGQQGRFIKTGRRNRSDPFRKEGLGRHSEAMGRRLGPREKCALFSPKDKDSRQGAPPAFRARGSALTFRLSVSRDRSAQPIRIGNPRKRAAFSRRFRRREDLAKWPAKNSRCSREDHRSSPSRKSRPDRLASLARMARLLRNPRLGRRKPKRLGRIAVNSPSKSPPFGTASRLRRGGARQALSSEEDLALG